MKLHYKKRSWFNKKAESQYRVSRENKNKQKVFSYYTASRKQLDSFERNNNMIQDETSRKRRIGKLRKYWFLSFVVVALACVVGYLLMLGTAPSIKINGTAYRDKKEYQRIVSVVFADDLRNRFKPLLQSKNLQYEVAKALPESQSVIIKSSFLGHEPEVIINQAEPMAIFAQNKNSFIMSNRGRLLLQSTKTNIDVTALAIVDNQSGLEAKEGMQFLRPDEADALRKLIYQYSKNNSVASVGFTINKIPHEIMAKESGRGYQIKYLMDNTIEQQYGAVIATQNKLQETNQQPSEYIDARLAEKIYFK